VGLVLVRAVLAVVVPVADYTNSRTIHRTTPKLILTLQKKLTVRLGHAVPVLASEEIAKASFLFGLAVIRWLIRSIGTIVIPIAVP